MQYLGGHLGIEDSNTGGPKFSNFVFGTQGVFVPNLKSVAQVVSEIQKMQYFDGHLGIEDSATWGPKIYQFCLWDRRSLCAEFQIYSSNSLRDMNNAIFWQPSWN